MADFPIKFKMISSGDGLAKLSSLSGHELTVPADMMHDGALGGEIIEIPLGSLISRLDDRGLSHLSRILMGCPR